MKDEKLLPAVYESQRDNIMDGGVTCAATTLSMLIQSNGMQAGEVRQGSHLEDEILTGLKAKYGNHKALREDFNFLAKWAKEKYGVSLKYKGYNKNDWLALMVNSGKPFMTSTSNALTSFGHIVLWRGYKVKDDSLSLCFNDPYGEFPYKSKNGEQVYYPASQFPFDDGAGKQKTYHTLSYA